MDELEGTRRGEGSYGSSSVNAVQDNSRSSSNAVSNSVSEVNSKQNEESSQRMKREPKMDATNKQNPLSRSRQIISARQIQKLAQDDSLVFLAIVQKTNEAPQKRINKRSSNHVAKFAAAHGMTEGWKWSINKIVGPKKDITIVAKRERQILANVPIDHRKNLEKIIHEDHDVFLEKLPMGIPPAR